MDAQLTVAMVACLGALTTLAGAVTLYVKQKTENEKRKAQIAEIVADRERVHKERDRAEQELRDNVQKATWEIDRLKNELALTNTKVAEQEKISNTLNVELAKISTKMDEVISALKDLKEKGQCSR